MHSPEPKRFALERTLGSGGMGVVYAAWDRLAERRVALKTLHELSADAVYRIKNEFRALADIEHPSLVRLDELHCEAGRWFFTMELLEGEAFRDHVCNGLEDVPARGDGARAALGSPRVPIPATVTATVGATSRAPLAQAPSLQSMPASLASAGRRTVTTWNDARLRAATGKLVEGLLHLHQLGRVHCDVKPSNVLVTPEGRVVLLDFGLARLWRGDGIHPVAHGKIEGTIAYMAPEQAAGAHPTPATDLYAVGVMLYEILAGRLPFDGSTAQVLAEKQRAEPPRRFPPGVPEDLARLTMSLLRRDPRARPGGAEVLELLGSATPASATLVTAASEATHDSFVGRAAELSRLGTELERSRTDFCPVLIRGQAGVGKSALVRHFATEARRHDRAVVLSSRCHEQEAVPLKAIDGIVDDLSRELLALSDGDAALSIPPDISALVQAFPALGRVPVVQRAARLDSDHALSIEQRDRAAMALAQMLRGLARDRPVILVIDDLQWADDASWPFLAKISTVEGLPVLLLATARPAPDAAHDPLGRIAQAAVPWLDRGENVELDGLPTESAIELLQQAVGASLDRERARELAAESKGHPLFLKELGRLVAGNDTGDRPVSLISALDTRVGALAPHERDVLETVCLAGSAIEVAAVARSLRLPLRDAAFAAQRLKRSQLLRIDARGEKRFAEPYHDRVREVVESRLEADNERRLDRHQAIGEALLDLYPEGQRDPVLFSIVNNLNRAARRRRTPETRVELARLNAQAARRAAEATAHAQALAFVERGMALLAEAGSNADAELAFELLATRMESQHLARDYAGARETFRELARRAATPAQIGRIYAIKIQLEGNADADAEAIRDYREGLAQLGFPPPRKPSSLRLIAELSWTQWTLRRWSAADLAALPAATDERVIAAGRIVSAGGSSLYRFDHQLLMAITLSWLRRSLTRGATRSTPNVMAGYAMILTGARLQFERAAEIVRAAMQLAERLDGPARSIFAQLTAGGWVLPWVRPYRESVELLRQAASEPRRIGEYLWINACLLGVSQILGWLGSSVEEHARALEAVRSDAERMNWRDHVTGLAMECRWVRLIADDAAGEDPRTIPPLREPGFQFAPWMASLRRVTAEFHFGSRESAHAASHALVNDERMGFGIAGRVVTALYRALAARALFRDAGWRQRRRLARDIAAARKLLARAARSCPENFRARQLLLEADVSRVRESGAEVDRRFEHAIEAATKHGDLQPLALAHELWAEALFERGDARARNQVDRACAAWERYGAPRIAARVRERFAVASPAEFERDL